MIIICYWKIYSWAKGSWKKSTVCSVDARVHAVQCCTHPRTRSRDCRLVNISNKIPTRNECRCIHDTVQISGTFRPNIQWPSRGSTFVNISTLQFKIWSKKDKSYNKNTQITFASTQVNAVADLTNLGHVTYFTLRCHACPCLSVDLSLIVQLNVWLKFITAQ